MFISSEFEKRNNKCQEYLTAFIYNTWKVVDQLSHSLKYAHFGRHAEVSLYHLPYLSVVAQW